MSRPEFLSSSGQAKIKSDLNDWKEGMTIFGLSIYEKHYREKRPFNGVSLSTNVW